MTYSRKFAAALAASVCVVAMATPAQAQVREFNISEGSLKSALDSYARQSGRQVIYKVDEVRNARSKGAKGTMSSDVALDRILEGTGFAARRDSSGAIAIVQQAAVTPRPTRPVASAQVSGEKGILIGEVIEASSNRRLPGARIVIRETGQETTTNDRGEFRFVNVPAGTVTVDAEYMGLDDQSQTASVRPDYVSSVTFSLGKGNEIVVLGGRSGRALALNEERSGDNSQTIISSDLLGQFNGTTISDALRRAPGIAFARDPDTGDGTNISVRGLAPEYNQVQINGVQLPVGNGRDRSPDLSNLLAGSISSVTINTTLMADQDSSGTGGLIEIETKSPLDRPNLFFNVGAEGVRRGKGFGEDYLFSATGSIRLGADRNFGISVSYQRREQDVTNIGYSVANGTDVNPQYLPLERNGQPSITSLANIDPRREFPFETGTDDFYPNFVRSYLNRTQSTTDAFTVTAEWKPFAGTNWRVDYVRSYRVTSRFSQQYLIGTTQTYRLAAVPALGGTQRRVLAANIFDVSLALNGNLNDQNNTDTVSFQGTTETGRFTFEYGGGYSRAVSISPFVYTANLSNFAVLFGQTLDATTVLPEAIDQETGQLSSIFGRRTGSGYPLPLLTQAGYNYLNYGDGIVFTSATIRDISGENDIYSGKFSTKYTLDSGILRFVQAGFDYRQNRAAAISPTTTGSYNGVLNNASPTLYPPARTVGLDLDSIALGLVSDSDRQLLVPSQASSERFIRGLPGLATAGTYVTAVQLAAPDALALDAFTQDKDFAAFIQAKFQIGDFDAVLGVRYSRITTEGKFVTAPSYRNAAGIVDTAFATANRKLVVESATQDTFLPRFLINYRPRKDMVFRFGYYSTIARPRLSSLSTTQNISYDARPRYGDNLDQPRLTISKGNPGLRSAEGHNFDFSAEWYFSSVGAIKFSAFYKIVENLIETNETRGFDNLEGVILPDDPRFQVANLPANLLVVGTQPFNNPDAAYTWGAVFSVERQLDFLPGFLGGFGVYANYTWAGSSKSVITTWTGSPVYDANNNVLRRETVTLTYKGVSFDQQPEHSGTLGLTYSKDGIDGSLYYSIQSRRRTSFRSFNLHQYSEAIDSLDLRLQYTTKLFGSNARIYLIGNDLLKGTKDPNTEFSLGGTGNTPRYYVGGNFLGGRSFSLGVSIDF